MPEAIFIGPFKKELKDYLRIKQSASKSYYHRHHDLRSFDTYLAEKHPDIRVLTKEIVTEWCKPRLNEKTSNQSHRISTIRQFTHYMSRINPQNWAIPYGWGPRAPKYVAHIYSVEELQQFFAAADSLPVHPNSPLFHIEMPEIFRLYLCCGLRRSEVLNLKMEDVDLDEGILKVLDAKNHKDRLIPIPEFMKKRLRDYLLKLPLTDNGKAWFFPSCKYRRIPETTIYEAFREILRRAGIPHTGDGPRLHDFRHTFCVYRLRLWTQKGEDLTDKLPYLKTYLGHNSFRETAYYLRLTADVFPDIREKLEEYYGDLIPVLESEDETN